MKIDIPSCCNLLVYIFLSGTLPVVEPFYLDLGILNSHPHNFIYSILSAHTQQSSLFGLISYRHNG